MEHKWAEGVEWSDTTAENFTGRVRFEAVARTDWHSHPEGQVLYVVEGRGRIQDNEGNTVEFGAREVYVGL